MKLGWDLIRRQWPLTVLLVALLALDREAAQGLPEVSQGWALPGALAVCGLALFASHRPIVAGLGVPVVLLLSSLLLRLLHAEIVGLLGLLSSEVAAVLAVIVVVIRKTPARTAAGMVGLIVAGCVSAHALRLWLADPSDTLVGDVLAPAAFLLSLAVGAGWYLRGRDAAHSRVTRAAVTAAQQRERLSLARELHDVVAHHIGGMVVQAQAAQAVAATDPGAAARVLPAIEGAGTDALSAMRRMVAALRDDEPDTGTPLIRTADLTADLHAVTATPAGGTPVRLAVDLGVPVPLEVATSVLRLVQESVTNARRHAAGAREIAVGVTAQDGTVQVLVRDDGRPGAEPRIYGGGYGLVGMRERAQLLGGKFSAGRVAAGGWQVAADLPFSNPEL